MNAIHAARRMALKCREANWQPSLVAECSTSNEMNRIAVREMGGPDSELVVQFINLTPPALTQKFRQAVLFEQITNN